MFMGLPLPNDVEPKALTVLLLCFETYENLRFWESEEAKSFDGIAMSFIRIYN